MHCGKRCFGMYCTFLLPFLKELKEQGDEE